MLQNLTSQLFLRIKERAEGSTVSLTDLEGEVTDRYHYSPYGVLLKHQGDSDNRFLYNGRDGIQTDSNGLYYMRARYYNPEIRRFINQDIILGEITNSQSLNRFAYVQGNPVSFIDPNGLFPVATTIGAFGGAIIGGATAWVGGTDIVTGAISGAVSGASVGVAADIIWTAPVSLPAAALVGAGFGLAGGAAGNLIDQLGNNLSNSLSLNESISSVNWSDDWTSAAVGAASGASAGFLSFKFKTAAAQFSAEILGSDLPRAHTINTLFETGTGTLVTTWFSLLNYFMISGVNEII